MSTSMKSKVACTGAVVALGLAAVALALVTPAVARGKGPAFAAPAAKAAVITGPRSPGRKGIADQVRPAQAPTKAYFDRACQRDGHRPHRCYPYSH